MDNTFSVENVGGEISSLVLYNKVKKKYLHQEVNMANTQYTEKQLKIISGEILLDTIDGYTAVWLYKKDVANGDTELITKVLERKEQLKEKARKKNIKRVVKSHTLRKEEIFQWKQPKSKDYTKHHKQIIRGEILFDKVHTNELIEIYQKARNNKDDVLADLVFDEISEFTSSYTALQQPCREYERNQAYVPYIS